MCQHAVGTIFGMQCIAVPQRDEERTSLLSNLQNDLTGNGYIQGGRKCARSLCQRAS